VTALLLAAVLLQGGGPPQAAADSAALRRDARRAEARFERIARERAPLTIGSWGGNCDEIVGRFCLTYSSESLPAPAPEPALVSHTRREAVEALRRAFAYAPAELDVTGPLVRYLIEDERGAEAASAARAYLALSADSVWGALLLGFALHATGATPEAERWFEVGLAALPEADRARIEDVAWLLSLDEARVYRRLGEAERAAYRQAFWNVADPLYLTPGNERRTEHIARHVWSRILSRTPRVADMERWGRDLEQLTVRYGTPRSRMRALGSRAGESSMVERYDPDQLAWTPEDLRRRGLPPAPLPGESWALDNVRARSGDAPVTIRRIVPLEHQATRFPEPDGSVLLRLDGLAVIDSAAAAADSVRLGMFLLDADYRRTHAQVVTRRHAGDTVAFGLQAPIPAGGGVYSLELFEPDTRFAARARYAVEVPAPLAGPRLSDILVASPFGSGRPAGRDDPLLRPRGSLITSGDETLGLYVEVTGLRAGRDGTAPLRVELTRHVADRSSLPREIVSWFGRRLGLSSEPAAPRVTWTETADPRAAHVIALDLGLGGARAGLYVIELAVIDVTSGTRVESRRTIRVR
jgi:hypothetical protein